MLRSISILPLCWYAYWQSKHTYKFTFNEVVEHIQKTPRPYVYTEQKWFHMSDGLRPLRNIDLVSVSHFFGNFTLHWKWLSCWRLQQRSNRGNQNFNHNALICSVYYCFHLNHASEMIGKTVQKCPKIISLNICVYAQVCVQLGRCSTNKTSTSMNVTYICCIAKTYFFVQVITRLFIKIKYCFNYNCNHV